MPGLNDLFELKATGKTAAIIGVNDRILTYEELTKRATRMRHDLAAYDIANFRIGVLVRQDELNIVCLLAMAGQNTMVPINPSYRHDKLPGLVESLGLDLIVTDAPTETDRVEVPIVVVHPDGACANLKEFQFAPSNRKTPEHVLIVPTSGSTGKPKLVGYTPENLNASAHANVSHFQLDSQDIYLCPMPLFHAHGLISIALFTLSVGGTVVLSPASPTNIWRKFERYLPTCFSAAPTIHQGLLRAFAGQALPSGNLRFARSSSAPLPYSIFDRLEALYDCKLIETYGLTESTSVVVANPLEGRKKGKVGKTIGQTEARILTEDGLRKLGQGELVLQGPAIVQTYVGSPHSGEDSRDAWFRTGDLVEIDEDGFISVQGRLKELVKRGGYGVSPAEVDNALCSISGVTAACTFSVPHPSLAEDLVSVVEVDAQADTDDRSVIKALMEKLVTYKVPTAIRIVDRIPRNAIGKFVRSDVREQFLGLFYPAFEPASTALEDQLIKFWEERLPVDRIGVFDNIILSGADPLLVSSLKQNEMIAGLSVPFLLRYPNVNEQAKYLQLETAE
ncbi:MAG: AMP-binding protein [Planctomycetota bacterium]|nr:AMP-binding protein [Planctomycetota bacterium]